MKRKPQAGQLDGERTKKPCRSDTTTRAAKSSNVKDSKSAREQAEPYRLATVRFPIDALSAIWTMGTNRPIDEAHKRKLAELFKDHGLRRSDVSNRLLVACGREDFEKMRGALGLANVNDGPSAPMGEAEPNEQAWPYFKDWMRVVGKPAELMAGNHRMEALKELLSRSENGDGNDERWWLCDLYDKDALPSLLHVRLRANREDVLLPDSHGQIWAEMATLASTDNTLFTGNSRELESEMVEALGLAGRTRFPTKRLVTLWRNKNWHNMITKLCCFPVGQALFSISAFEWMASCRIDDFWFSFFKKAIDSATRVRQSYRVEIEPHDWSQLARLSETSSHADIMALFYPELVGDPYSDEPGARRPKFLSALDDEKYKEFYLHILTRVDLRFPDAHLLMKTTKREGKIMSTVIAHIGYWLNNTPAVVQERNVSKPLLRTAFLPALQKRHGRHANQKSIELEYQVLTYVREQMHTFTDKAAEHFLDVLPTSTEQDYNRRFDHSPWKNILIMVHATVGPHFENEIVARFNREDPNTLQSKPLKTILHDICDGISSSPEIAQSSVLGKRAAIQTLHETLQPIIAKWAVDQYDMALQLSSDDWEPAELAQVRAERTRYVMLQDADVAATDSVSSDGEDSIDFFLERSERTETAPRPQNRVYEGIPKVITPNLVRQRMAAYSGGRTPSGLVVALDGGGDRIASNRGDGHGTVAREPPLAARDGTPSLDRDTGSGQFKGGPGHRIPAGGVDTLPKAQPRVPESARKSWRARPVAQLSVGLSHDRSTLWK